MTKSKTIIATLGIVAGLGAAALPLCSYATENVSGNVDLYVEVNPAIAMSITGNNDDNTYYGTQADDSVPEHPVASDNAAVHVKAPGAASQINGTDVSTFETSTATKASSSYVSLLPNAYASTTSTVTVYTNNTDGYTLKVEKGGDTTSLVNAESDTITAGAVTEDTGGAGHWALKGGDIASLTALDGTNGNVLKANGTRVSGGQATTVTYGISTSTTQNTGVYHIELEYTATTK